MISRSVALIIVMLSVGLLAVGCASKQGGPTSPEARTENNGVSVTAKPFTAKADIKEEFDRDPASVGYLAIRVEVRNDTADTLTLGQSGVALACPDGKQRAASRIDIKHVSAVAEVAGFLVMGSQNWRIDQRVADWNNKGLPAMLEVEPETSESRFAYFDFRPEEGKVEPIPPGEYRLLVNISRDDGGKWETFALPVELSER